MKTEQSFDSRPSGFVLRRAKREKPKKKKINELKYVNQSYLKKDAH